MGPTLLKVASRIADFATLLHSISNGEISALTSLEDVTRSN